MTIDDAIEKLRKLGAQHGGQVQVFFDCPKCVAFMPDMVGTAAVHIKAEEPQHGKDDR